MTGKRDLQAEITERVIDALERGTVPWQKPWNASGILPTSVATGRPYRGINVFLLSLTASAKGYGSPYWLTFRQAKGLGGSVRKGEHGTTVIFWKMQKVGEDEVATPSGVEYRDRLVPLMRAYTVFNVEQCDGLKLPPRFLPSTEERPEIEPDAALAEILAGYKDGPALRYVTGDAAYYDPAADRITLPELDQWRDAEGYAGTLLHELTHSTGHPSRLDRFARNGEPQHFGSERYAREELVAEMGAALLGAEHGIALHFDNQVAYVKSWLGRLREDTSLVVTAAQQAQRAADRITGRTFDGEGAA